MAGFLARKIGEQHGFDVGEFNPLFHENGTNRVDDHDDVAETLRAALGRYLGDEIIA